MLEFIRFEIQYRLARPATYIYFALILLMAFLATATDAVQAGGAGGNVMQNSPLVISQIMSVILIFAIFIVSAVMGVPVLRDFDHKTDAMIFTTPIKKFNYLAGKFTGSFIIILFILSGMLLGIILGQAVPWPWLDNADKLMPFSFSYYLNPFAVVVLPTVVIFSMILFAGGTLGKRMTVVYAQGIILFMGYLVASQFISDLDNRQLGALLDPFGLGAVSVHTQYWTVSEQNNNLLPFSGIIMQSRLLWLGIGLLIMVFTFFKFSFSLAGKAGKKAKTKTKAEKIDDTPAQSAIPAANPQFDWRANVTQLISLSWFYFRWIIKQVPFIFIALAGIVFLFIIAFVGGTQGYGIELYVTSARAVSLMNIFNLFFIIITVFYTGEIIWKERDIKMNLIYDALPYPNFVSLLSKLFGLILMSIFILMVLMFSGILIQVIKGYPVIEWDVYIANLFGETLAVMTLYIILGLFVQVMLNHKFLGFGFMFIFYIFYIVLGEFGVEHSMFYFARIGIGSYSDMNEFGHYPIPFGWFNLYWFGLATVFFMIAILFTVRGLESKLFTRLKLSKLRLKPQAIIVVVISLLVFIGSGAFIFYNTNIINEYQNSDVAEKMRAEYEKQLSQYEFTIQPRIIDTYLEVDLYPLKRDFKTMGYYILKNKSDEVINEIHIQNGTDTQLETVINFEAAINDTSTYKDFGYTIYRLQQPLQPGDTVKMNFEVTFTTRGFRESGDNSDIVYNGTFFNNTSYFPSIGYNSGFELSDDDDRKDYDLEVKERMMDRDDSWGLSQSLFGDDADKIQFEIVIITDTSQIAIAPGYLQREWQEGDRAYYHYKMDTPMVNFYSIVSADYEVIEDVWENPVDSLSDVNLEIYHHQGHDYNTDKMMAGMKDALSYYSREFSPFQFRQLRIMEFPRYRSFAQSFANTVPFSEGIGFIQKIKTDDVDLPYYVTAHEVAHQWWGHQVTEAGVKGNAMLSETLSQYSALMVMKQKFPAEIIKEFLRHELNSYLMGRTFESKKEMPLELVEGQGYIHYRKGSLVMYALQDYIGEDSVNAALKRFVSNWGFKEAPYPTSKDLLGYFREVTPDSLQYLLTDWFETITLYENKTSLAEYEKLEEDKYLVDLEISAIKYRADTLGREEAIAKSDWIDIGVFTEGSNGKDSLIYLQKHLIDADEVTFEIEVSAKPTKAGIDPINKLIDRNPGDNVKKVTEKEEEPVS
jgi:ABC-2 type transport system permease protein